jgi:2-succinyl-5-enolpyruvyl-6-hydroxy-3-cyclohexene-1-carboxylate synthase
MSSPTASHVLLRALVDEFVRCGMEHACTAPGSRNSPIILALASDGRLRCWSHVDERSAGFFALGAAKASRRPVVVACTSGTAAANLLPAVIESDQAGVPLIVLTADRPAELREVGAGQTIDQLKLYGDAVRWFFEPDLADADPGRLRWIRALACRAYWTALGPRPGPVHLNIPLREPLVLDGPLPDEPGGGGRSAGGPWLTVDRPMHDATTPRRHEFAGVVFVAGELGGDPELGAELASFSARAGVPLLADPLSGARRGPAAIAHYDLFLRDGATATALKPVVVCRIGELPTSKPLRNWIAGLHDAYHVAFSNEESWTDPDSMLIQRTVGPLDQLIRRLQDDEVVAAPAEWLALWRQTDAIVTDAVSGILHTGGLSEPLIAERLGSSLPPDATLLVASSMPIRDVETYLPIRDEPPRILANRGANGIDGTVSAAFGVAAVSDGPVVLLIGDVALAHDIGGLLANRRTDLAITIILINNDGGGIFHFLPVVSQGDPFEEHIATPTGLEFDRAAALYGCGYQLVADVEALEASVSASLAADQTTIIEIRTERVANRQLHAELEAAALAALRDRRPGAIL